MLAVNLKMIEQFVELNINYMSIICLAKCIARMQLCSIQLLGCSKLPVLTVKHLRKDKTVAEPKNLWQK